MGTLWQFFGFPDPEAPAPESVKKSRKRKPKAEETPGQQLTLVSPDDAETTTETETAPSKLDPVNEPEKEVRDIPPPVRRSASVPQGWTGPLTPDGDAFHDLSNYSAKPTDFPDRALRYVVPDQMHRLPIRQIQDRVMRGDTIIVDLNGLIHMDTQTNACRRSLKQIGDEMNIDIFALDESDKLLLLPGSDVSMDVSKNDLGLIPLLI
tara:strand:- start:3304 stop:3927 length:624 start_codon:yes stop_codon:yes gene_type:complete